MKKRRIQSSLRLRLWQGMKAFIRGFIVTCALLGGYTFFHFYFQPSGIADGKTHKKYNRAQLIDVLISRALVQDTQTK